MSSTATDEAGPSPAAESKKQKDYEIVVNGEHATVRDERVTFEEVVAIAYPTPPSPDAAFTVTYRNAKGRVHEGEIAPGEWVDVKKKGTAFDVTPTGKS